MEILIDGAKLDKINDHRAKRRAVLLVFFIKISFIKSIR